MSKQNVHDPILNSVLIALFAAFVAALGLVPKIDLPGGVPITAQTLGVMIAGAVLGPVRGFLALLVFYVLLAVGMPFLPGGRGGIAPLVGIAGGYILGWVFGAFVVGLLVQFAFRAQSRALVYAGVFASCLAGGVVIVYLFGIPWQYAVAGVPIDKALIGSLAFIPGDIIKALIASFVAISVRKYYRF